MSIQKESKLAKIIAISGTTASGKTSLGVDLAYNFEGEIISADSRQVYKGMDIGTGKDLDEYVIRDKADKKFKIPYHLIDVVEPNREFNLAEFQKMAYQAIERVLSKNKLPIVVGGTGLYLQSLIDGYQLSGAGQDMELRSESEQLSSQDLFEEIKKRNPGFASRINSSDKKNKLRLIRYLEVLSGQEDSNTKNAGVPKFDSLVLGLTHPMEELEKRIYRRLVQRLEQEGLIDEVERLHQEGLSWSGLEKFGLEYRWVAYYLQEKIDYEEMLEKLYLQIRKFAKKQITWLKRWERQGRRIHWIKSREEARDLVRDFIKK